MIRINTDANAVSLAHRMHIALLKAAGNGYCGATPRRRIRLEFVAGLVAGPPSERTAMVDMEWNALGPQCCPAGCPGTAALWLCTRRGRIPPATNGRRARRCLRAAVEAERARPCADGKIYLAYGIMDGHTSGTVAWFDEFDPAIGEWTELPDTPRARDHFSAVVSDGQLDLVGGRNTSYHEPDYFTAFLDEVVAGKWMATISRRGLGRPCRPSCLCRPPPVGLRLATDRSTTSVARQGRTWRIRTRIVSTQQRGNGIRPAIW